MKNKRRWTRGGVASLVILALFSTACLQFKTNTDIKLESYKDSVTIYQKNAGAPDGYAAEQIELTRYRMAKVQSNVLDLGQTILSTLEIVGSICLSAAFYLMLTTVKSVGRIY